MIIYLIVSYVVAIVAALIPDRKFGCISWTKSTLSIVVGLLWPILVVGIVGCTIVDFLDARKKQS